MIEDDVVATVLDRLERLGIEYMLVGSYASNAYGRPRGSYDADVVVQTKGDDAHRLFEAFNADFLVDLEALTRDLERGTLYNLIPKSGVFKVDLIPLRRTEFAREEFSRRRRVTALGRSISMASPEDTILSKLEWYRKGGEVSERQIEDARDVYAVQKGTLDEGYLDHWARALGVEGEWQRIRRAVS